MPTINTVKKSSSKSLQYAAADLHQVIDEAKAHIHYAKDSLFPGSRLSPRSAVKAISEMAMVMTHYTMCQEDLEQTAGDIVIKYTVPYL